MCKEKRIVIAEKIRKLLVGYSHRNCYSVLEIVEASVRLDELKSKA